MMNLKGVSGPQNVEIPDDLMDLDEPVQSRQAEGHDQVVVDAMDLCERVAEPYDRGFFLSLPEGCLTHLLTYLVVLSFKHLSEISKEMDKKLWDIYHQKIKHTQDLTFDVRFILEHLEADIPLIRERSLLWGNAFDFLREIHKVSGFEAIENRDALSFHWFEGSHYQYSLHLLSMKKAFEDYNEGVPDDQKLTLKSLFQNYVSDRIDVEEALEKGADFVDQISCMGIVLSPEFSSLGQLPKLWLHIINKQFPFQNILFTFVHLKELNLEGEVYELLPEIRNLKQLEVLEVRKNLESLPSEIGELSSLKELYLMDNKSLATLPDSITQLKLNVFDVRDSGIRLTNLSKEVREWTKGISEFKIEVPYHVRSVRQYLRGSAF